MAKNPSMNPSNPNEGDPNAPQPSPGGDGPMHPSYTGDAGQAAATQGEGPTAQGARTGATQGEANTAPGAKMGNPQVQPQTGAPKAGSYQCRVLKNVAIGGSKENPNGRKLAVGEVDFFTEEEIAEAPTAFERVDSNQSIRST